ncbi:MAG: hypothetical protein ACI849_000727 [Patiriisocius sp.]|jgi:hypothetical protein
MKNLFLFLSLSSFLFISSCSNDDDDQEISEIGQVFETTLDFTFDNDYSQLVNIPSYVDVYESDVILVYWLEDVIPGNNGESFDLWSPLPQTIYLDGGSFQYTFNHTFIDVLLFLQGDINLNTLGSDFTNNQTFRIAVVPAEFADTNPTMEDVLAL